MVGGFIYQTCLLVIFGAFLCGLVFLYEFASTSTNKLFSWVKIFYFLFKVLIMGAGVISWFILFFFIYIPKGLYIQALIVTLLCSGYSFVMWLGYINTLYIAKDISESEFNKFRDNQLSKNKLLFDKKIKNTQIKGKIIKVMAILWNVLIISLIIIITGLILFYILRLVF